MQPEFLVIDTNVCLDLFIFSDPRCVRLHAALLSGTHQAITRDDCQEEWRRVLRYAQLSLSPEQITQAEAQYCALFRVLDLPIATSSLPRCTDKDDQKFLELARDARATCLISKDKALLKLARKTRDAGLFSICKPEQFASV